MDTLPTVVSSLKLDLIDSSGSATPLEAELRYESKDPYAVVAVFYADGSPVDWVFSRELLASGVYEPTGDGDVHVWPCLDSSGRAVVMVELSAPDGDALLQLSSSEVSEFLLRTRDVVPPGEEARHLDLDTVVSRLLADTSGAT